MIALVYWSLLNHRIIWFHRRSFVWIILAGRVVPLDAMSALVGGSLFVVGKGGVRWVFLEFLSDYRLWNWSYFSRMF